MERRLIGVMRRGAQSVMGDEVVAHNHCIESLIVFNYITLINENEFLRLSIIKN